MNSFLLIYKTVQKINKDDIKHKDNLSFVENL